MTQQDPDNNDTPPGAQRLFETLRSAAVDTATRETLRELGDRARGVVEDLARSARSRAAAAESRAAAEAESVRRERESARTPRPEAASGSSILGELSRRIEELLACVNEVSDMLAATVERLETIEFQLGDPDDSVDDKLARSLEHCEQLLKGIEYRFGRAEVEAANEGLRLTTVSESLPTVLVVAASSARRAALCVDLEKIGMRCLAASDFVAVRRWATTGAAEAALLVVDRELSTFIAMLDEWKDGEEQSGLPPALVLEEHDGVPGLAQQAAACGFSVTSSRHGVAALAADLTRLVRAADATVPSDSYEEQ